WREMVEIERGVEEQHVAAARLHAPERVGCEAEDVPLAEGHVDDGCLAGKLRTAGEHATHEQLLFGRESQDHARPLRFWRHHQAGTLADPRRNVTLFAAPAPRRSGLRRRPPLRNVRVISSATAGRTLGRSGPEASAARAPPPAAEAAKAGRHVEHWGA